MTEMADANGDISPLRYDLLFLGLDDLLGDLYMVSVVTLRPRDGLYSVFRRTMEVLPFWFLTVSV